MSSWSSSSSSSSEEIHPFLRRVRWIKTLLWKGLVNPLNLRVGEYTNSDPALVNGINSTLTFVLRRSEPDILTLSCIRNVIGPEALDDKCYIKFYVSFYNFDERARRRIMCLDSKNTLDIVYYLQFCRRLDSQQYETLVKCSIRLVEMENTSNLERERQEEELFRMTREVCTSSDQLIEMAYVLRRAELGDVYTGRMEPSSASIMSTLIANACRYSRYIYEYIKARDESEPTMPNIPLTEILSGLCEPQQFNEYVCTLLFRAAHGLGLEFLRVLCSAYLIENLDDNSVLDTIVLAVGTEDSELFQAAAEYFLRRQSIIISSDEWALQQQEDDACLQIVLISVHHRSTTGDWYYPPLPELEFTQYKRDFDTFKC